MSEPKWPAFSVSVIVLWIAALDCRWQTYIPARKCGSKMDSGNSLCSFFSVPLCTQSVPLPVFLQHIISSVTVGSKAPCLVVHIQSCRLKQIAICMPLGEKSIGKHHPSSHLCISLNIPYSRLQISVFLPLLLWPSEQGTVRAITAISVASCQADWEVAAKTKERVSNHYDGVWFGGVSKRLLGPSVGRLEEENNSSLGQDCRWGGSTRTHRNLLWSEQLFG